MWNSPKGPIYLKTKLSWFLLYLYFEPLGYSEFKDSTRDLQYMYLAFMYQTLVDYVRPFLTFTQRQLSFINIHSAWTFLQC